MSWIIVIEDSQEFAEQIKEAFVQIEPAISVVQFNHSSEFVKWLGLLGQKNPEAMAKVPPPPFKGVVTGVETWNFRDIQLIEKFRPLFVQFGFAPNEQELCVVLTGYDTPQLNKKRYEQRSVNNFIYKPFDKLLLKQMLEIAFTGRQPVAKYYIHNLKTEMQIEMLKEIRLSEVSEIGFQTISDQKVIPGKIAKYYADFLTTTSHKSALAKGISETEIPGTQMSRVNLGFFALDQQQSFNLQKLIQATKATRTIQSTPEASSGYEFIFLQHEKSDLCQQIQPSIERFFDHSIKVVRVLSELGVYLKESQELKDSKKRILFVDSYHFYGNELAEVQTLKTLAGEMAISIYLLSPRIFAEALEFELSQVCEDIYYAPFNRSYIIKTLKRRWPSLNNKEEIFENHSELNQLMHVSNPVKVVEVSEAGLVMQYYRELGIGTFREFIFWMPNEVDVPILLGQCNYVEFMKEQKIYNCHFVFFGLQDFQKKHIRLWMLHNYIENKSEEQ